MVFSFIVRYVSIAAITFIVINIMTPFLWGFWNDHLRDEVDTGSEIGNTLVTAGDNIFGSWIILSFMVPGIIIMWGFAVAHRKRVVDRQVG